MTEQHRIELVATHHFSIEQLVEAYNQTRIDYIVPMPMNTQRLSEYMYLYDIDQRHSYVALTGSVILGLGMLGVRNKLGWITRLGVLTQRRKGGIGGRIVEQLIAEAYELNLERIILEVIVHNDPAYQLFLQKKFEPVDELLVLRRPPSVPPEPAKSEVQWLQRNEIIALLEAQTELFPWTNQPDTFRHALTIEGCRIQLANGDSGWAVFRRQPLILSHIILHTEQGDPYEIGHALLCHIHRRHPYLDTHAENIRVGDVHRTAYEKLGYIEAFRRNEMYLDLG